jgi:hypothetical protein
MMCIRMCKSACLNALSDLRRGRLTTRRQKGGVEDDGE